MYRLWVDNRLLHKVNRDFFVLQGQADIVQQRLQTVIACRVTKMFQPLGSF